MQPDRRQWRKLRLLLLALLVLGALALWMNADSLRRWRFEHTSTEELVAAARRDPHDVVLVKVAGQRCLDQNLADQAQDFLLAAAQEHPLDAELNVLAGRAVWDMGDLQRAGTLLNAALQAAPQNINALFWTAELLLSRGRKTEAVSLLLDATRVDPGRGDIWRRLAEIDLNSQDYKAALEHLDHAEKATPTGKVARLRAAALLFLNRAPEAEQAARLAVQREPGGATYRMLGEILQESTDEARLREAQGYFKQALQSDAHDTQTLKLLALNHRTLGEHAQAVKVLRRMLKETPALTEGYLLLGQSYQALGKSQLSEKTLRIFRTLQPLQEKADRARQRVLVERGTLAAEINYVRALLALGRNDLAREILERAWSKAPHNSTIKALAAAAQEAPALPIDPLPPDPAGDAP